MIETGSKVTHKEFGIGIVASVKRGGHLYEVLFPKYSSKLIPCRLGEISPRKNTYKRHTVSEILEEQSEKIKELKSLIRESSEEANQYTSEFARGMYAAFKAVESEMITLEL